MKQKYQKYIGRFKELIKGFDEDIHPQRIRKIGPYNKPYYIYSQELKTKIRAWLMKCENLISLVFGIESLQMKRFHLLMGDPKIKYLDTRISQIKGLLEADLDDLENGFLTGQEFIIANEVFDSLLEEAKFFIFKQKNKKIGAILLRIVLEDAIKRIAEKEGISVENKRVSGVNNELKSSGTFIQTVWRQNQAWLDIGNHAAHGEFDKYDLSQVENFYNGIINFLSGNFS